MTRLAGHGCPRQVPRKSAESTGGYRGQVAPGMLRRPAVEAEPVSLDEEHVAGIVAIFAAAAVQCPPESGHKETSRAMV